MKTIKETRYKGLTKRQYKQKYGSTTAGREKGETCHATGFDKALAKYPRAYKKFPEEYFDFNLKKDKAAQRANTFFQRTN